MQTDPAKGEQPWARGVVGSDQVLVCPRCQADDPTWADALEACPRCSGTRLSIVMGSILCRECGFDFPAD